MKFGLFYEISVPRPWTRESERTVYENALEAATALRERWGLPVVPGHVTLTRRHDRITATVARDGATVLDAGLVDPEPIAGRDVQYIHSVTLARRASTARPVRCSSRWTPATRSSARIAGGRT